MTAFGQITKLFLTAFLEALTIKRADQTLHAKRVNYLQDILSVVKKLVSAAEMMRDVDYLICFDKQRLEKTVYNLRH